VNQFRSLARALSLAQLATLATPHAFFWHTDLRAHLIRHAAGLKPTTGSRGGPPRSTKREHHKRDKTSLTRRLYRRIFFAVVGRFFSDFTQTNFTRGANCGPTAPMSWRRPCHGFTMWTFLTFDRRHPKVDSDMIFSPRGGL